MSNRPPWLFAALTAALILAPTLASAQPGHTPIGKKGEIELDRPTHIGATLLQPGHYQVQHKMVDGQHALIVRQQETTYVGRDHRAGTTGPEVARIPCRIVTFDSSATLTAVYWTKEADGSATVAQIRIMGEGAGHIVAIEPVTSK